MEWVEQLKLKTAEEVEEWFLEELSRPEPPLRNLMAALPVISHSAGHDLAASCADMLQDVLLKSNDFDVLTELLMVRSEWQADNAKFREVCLKLLTRASQGRDKAAFVKNAGFDSGVPLKECFRRLQVLLSMVPGLLCHDKTWGFGVLRTVDGFYGKVTIDFNRKAGHQMSFAYAAETLELVGEDHVMARRHRDPEEMSRRVREDPGWVVKMVLASYGPMSVPLLQELMVGPFLKEEEWKPFWEKARKALKADPLVQVPTKRTDPILLLEKAHGFDGDWFAGLAGERDTDRILALLEEYAQEADASSRDSSATAILDDRLNFLRKAAEGSRPELLARTAILTRRLGREQVVDGAGMAESLLVPETFLCAMSRLSVRDGNPLLEHLAGFDPERAAALFLNTLPRISLSMLDTMIGHLAQNQKEAGAEILRGLIRGREAGPEILSWACRHMATVAEWELGAPLDLILQAIDALGVSASGEKLKAQNQIKALFEKNAWINSLLQALTPEERKVLIGTIYRARGWDSDGRRAAMAKMVVLCPELKDALASGSSREAEQEPQTQGKFTSWRSYRERQEQLRRLVQEQIPENSREIAQARSYGDLRENHEYKAAKEHQGILMRRQMDWERDLKEVRPTDFADSTFDTAKTGTCVVVRRPSGERESYYLLGEWDSDEKLGILPCGSVLARQLDGKKVGDQVLLPARGSAGLSEGEPCIIHEIKGLPDEIKSWISA